MPKRANPAGYRVLLLGFGYLALGLLKGLLGAGAHCHVAGLLPWSRCGARDVRDAGEDALIRLATQVSVPVLACRSVNGFDFASVLEATAPDLVLVGSWGEIIQPHMLQPAAADSAPLFVNCHPSLLPMHRGPNPYVSAIREGERETGVTFHRITEGIDSGPVLLQKALPIADHDTGGSLRRKVFEHRPLRPEFPGEEITNQDLHRRAVHRGLDDVRVHETVVAIGRLRREFGPRQ